MTNETAIEVLAHPQKWYRPLFYQWQKSFGGWTVILMSALTLYFIGYQVFNFGETKQIAMFADAVQAVLSLAVFVLAWRVTRHPAIDEDSRRAWRILTASFLFYSFGHTLWFYYSSVLEIKPFPSLADIGFWMFYPLMLWSLFSFPTAQVSNSHRLKFVMDVLIVLLGGTTAAWHFIIRPTIETAAEGESLMTALNHSYVVGDLVLFLGIATILFRVPARVNKIALYTIVFGLLNTAVSDIGFALFTLGGTYTSGHWVDNFFITGLLTFLIACYFQYQNLSQTDAADEETNQDFEARTFSWLPYLAIAVVFGILLLETRQYWSDWLGVIVFSALGMTGLVVLRQMAAVKENIGLLAEQAARQNELKFKTLVKHSTDLITLRDKTGKVTFRSPSLKNILGYEPEEIDKYDLFEMIHPDDAEDLINALKELDAGSIKVYRQEYRYKHKDGSWRVMEGFAKNVDDEQGGLQGVLVNSRDITQRKMDEEKLKIYTAKLERSNRELQDFAYVASHDLQEPLRKVQAFGERLEKKYADALEDEARDYIRRMRDASARMQTLINDLLTFSRVSSKAQPFSRLDLNKITKEVVSDLEVRIEQTNAKVEIGELPDIDADAIQMRQLLQNLIGNALKFHNSGTAPVVKIYAENYVEKGGAFQIDNEEIMAISTGFETKDEGEKVCRLIVEDNGIGFEEKYLDRIFTVFQRLHGRSDYEGSGVGLAVCRKIIERHNGEITAESAPNKGAKFIVTLPLKQTEGNFI